MLKTVGEISTRYARALLKYAASQGVKREVYHEVQSLLEGDFSDNQPLSRELTRFVSLVKESGRLDYIRQIFKTFLSMYRESENILLASLITAVPIPGLEEKLKTLLEQQSGKKVIIHSRLDPSIIGGFVLKTDQLMLDASMKRRIEKIRKEYLISTNRIV